MVGSPIYQRSVEEERQEEKKRAKAKIGRNLMKKTTNFFNFLNGPKAIFHYTYFSIF